MPKRLNASDRQALLAIRDNTDIKYHGGSLYDLTMRGLIRRNEGAPQGYSINPKGHDALNQQGKK